MTDILVKKGKFGHKDWRTQKEDDVETHVERMVMWRQSETGVMLP